MVDLNPDVMRQKRPTKQPLLLIMKAELTATDQIQAKAFFGGLAIQQTLGLGNDTPFGLDKGFTRINSEVGGPDLQAKESGSSFAIEKLG